MHLNKILEQIKRHQSPSEAIDKLSTALEKHEGSLLEKGFTILKSELAANMYEAINGPHFDEEHARYAVEGTDCLSVSKPTLCKMPLLQDSATCLVKMLQDSTFLVLR